MAVSSWLFLYFSTNLSIHILSTSANNVPRIIIISSSKQRDTQLNASKILGNSYSFFSWFFNFENILVKKKHSLQNNFSNMRKSFMQPTYDAWKNVLRNQTKGFRNNLRRHISGKWIYRNSSANLTWTWFVRW